METLKIKKGDWLRITACTFKIPCWPDSKPCFVFSPVLQFHQNVDSAESVVKGVIESIELLGYLQPNIEDWGRQSIKGVRRSINLWLMTKIRPNRSLCDEVVSVEVEVEEYKDSDGNDRIRCKEINRIKM